MASLRNAARLRQTRRLSRSDRWRDTSDPPGEVLLQQMSCVWRLEGMAGPLGAVAGPPEVGSGAGAVVGWVEPTEVRCLWEVGFTHPTLAREVKQGRVK